MTRACSRTVRCVFTARMAARNVSRRSPTWPCDDFRENDEGSIRILGSNSFERRHRTALKAEEDRREIGDVTTSPWVFGIQV